MRRQRKEIEVARWIKGGEFVFLFQDISITKYVLFDQCIGKYKSLVLTIS